MSPSQLQVFDALGRDERRASHQRRPRRRRSRAPAGAGGPPHPRDGDGDPPAAARVAAKAALRPQHDRRRSHRLGPRSYQRKTDPSGLLGAEFTLSDLQRVHEAVLGTELVKDTFRRTFSEYLPPPAPNGPAVVSRHMTRNERHAHRARQKQRRTATRRSRAD